MALNFDVFKQNAQQALTIALGNLLGKKDLVLDPSLMAVMNRLFGMAFLRTKEVNKVFMLSQQENMGGCDQRVFLVRPNIATMKSIAAHINADKRANKRRKYLVLVLPRRLYVCDMVLEQEGVFGNVQIDELNINFLALDDDLLTLDNNFVLNSVFMDGDYTWLHSVAQSIVQLQTYFGVIPNMCGQGKAAKIVHKLVQTLMKEKEIRCPSTSKIDRLVLIDRSVDFVTPLCSQVTYEGLLDDIFTIECGQINFGTEVTKSSKPVKDTLDSTDPIFNDIRNKHFTTVIRVLQQKLRDLKAAQQNRQNMEVAELRDFVQNDFKQLQAEHRSVTLHFSAAEVIMQEKTKASNKQPNLKQTLEVEHNLLEGVRMGECVQFIEECIHRQYDITITLRLLCLLSCVKSGLDRNTYINLKEQFLRSYGFNHMLTFFNLKKLGLLDELQTSKNSAKATTTASTGGNGVGSPSSSIESNLNRLADRSSFVSAQLANFNKKDVFRAVAKKLSLVPKFEDIGDVGEPRDMSYVLSGAYIPLSCRLVEQAIERKGWRGMEDVMNMLPGDTFEKEDGRSVKGGGAGGASPAQPKVVVAYFVGGVTYTEVAALRFLARRKKCTIVIATTSIINGKRLIQPFVHGSS